MTFSDLFISFRYSNNIQRVYRPLPRTQLRRFTLHNSRTATQHASLSVAPPSNGSPLTIQRIPPPSEPLGADETHEKNKTPGRKKTLCLPRRAPCFLPCFMRHFTRTHNTQDPSRKKERKPSVIPTPPNGDTAPRKEQAAHAMNPL